MLQRTLWPTLLALLCLPIVAAPVAAAPIAAVTDAVSLQAAVAAARPGDTIQLAAQSYTADLELAASGSAAAPITLRGAPGGGSRLAGTIRVEGSFWTIEGLEVDAGGASRDAIRLDTAVHDIAIRRVHLHNGRGYGVRVGNDVARVTIEDCIIEDFDAGEKDAHGVGIMTASDVTIRRCDIFATSGDAIQVNTPDYPGYGRAASNIQIEQNKLHHTRENALDIKSTHGIVVRDNLAWSFAAVDSSDGMAIQVQYDARDVQLIANQIWAAVEGIEVSRGVKNGTPYPLAPQNVLIAGNLIHSLNHDPNGDSGSGSGIVVRSSAGVRLYNNSVLNVPGAAVYVSYSASGQYPQGLEIRNNLLDGAANDLNFAFDPKLAPGLVVGHNHYRSGRVSGGSLSRWVAQGWEAHASSGDPQIDPVSMRPHGDGPLVDSGAELGLPHTGAAPDRGWGELSGPAPTLAVMQQIYLPQLSK
jgi:hypothetical protein